LATASLSFFLPPSAAPLHPPPFPTRRSSDLILTPARRPFTRGRPDAARPLLDQLRRTVGPGGARPAGVRPPGRGAGLIEKRPSRSEEHTSELQSPYDLVCRLLLEKKKKKEQK